MFKFDLFDGERKYTTEDIKRLVLGQTSTLGDEKNVVIFADDNFKFIINFLTCIYLKKEVYLLNDREKLHKLDNYQIAGEIVGEKEGILEEINPDEAIINFYTSGSSSEPKLIKKTLQNLIEEAKDLISEFNFEQGLNFISTTQLNHLFGITFHLMVPYVGGFTIHTETINYPDEANVENAFFVSTPAFLEKFKKHNVELKTPPKWIVSSGSKLKNDVFEYMEKNSKIIEIYGSTETGVIGYRRHFEDNFLNKFKNVRLSQDEENRAIVESNYFPEDSMLQNDVIEFLAGDKFKLIGRTDRMFKIQDKRVSAPEIENEIKKNKLIEDSYCLKIGEKLGCAIVLKEIPNNHLEFIKELKKRIKSEIVPQKWKILPEIPKTQTGKIDRKKIEKIFSINFSYPIITKQTKDQNSVELELYFPKNANYFQGHFDNFPILPGVVQLFFAHWMIDYYLDLKISNSDIKKIKFTNIIKPDEPLKLSLIKKDGLVLFKYHFNDKIYSSGNFALLEIK